MMHVAKECTKPKSLSEGKINLVISDSEKSIGTYGKLVRIGNGIVNALIDTGSSDCTIKASVVIENGFEISRVSSNLLGFG